MKDIQTTPTLTTPPHNNRGRKADPNWTDYRTILENPVLRDGNWYEIPFYGMSTNYARRIANKRGFATAVENGVLKVCVPTTGE